MAKKATLTKVTDVKVGDIISRRNVLKDQVEFFKITYIRNTGTRYALNYADAVTGQQVDYLALDGDDEIHIITED
jgi:hypothetical protein